VPNYRPGVDAGWRVLFVFSAAWPRATQAGRSERAGQLGPHIGLRMFSGFRLGRASGSTISSAHQASAPSIGALWLPSARHSLSAPIYPNQPLEWTAG
jgi:hypothetical protein